jgi:hypothetical protein
LDWPKIAPAPRPDGHVLFGLSHPESVIDVTRTAVLMSHYYGALPLAVHVAGGGDPTDFLGFSTDLEGERLFEAARSEAHKLGYPLRTYSEFAGDTTEGIRRAAVTLRPHAVVLGLPYSLRAPGFSRMVDAVAHGSGCPVILAKLSETADFRRILVLLGNQGQLVPLQPLVSAFGSLGEKQLTVLLCASRESQPGDLARTTQELNTAVLSMGFSEQAPSKVVLSESPLQTTLDRARKHDLVVLSIGDQGIESHSCSGILTDDLARRIDCSILLVRGDLRLRSAERPDSDDQA